jgi:hypothetical protein
MQSSQVKSSMYPIWAVTLYILIGCADSITAYSLDDNEQFYRQLYQLVMYNIYALLLILAVSSNWGYIPVAFLVAIAENKFVHRLYASRLASASWNLNKMVADYMYQEHTKSGPAYDPASMKGYHYLVDWPLSDSELAAGTSYATELKADSGQVIDIEKVWQCRHRSLSEELKYTCLSFSLFHLLRRRFFGFDCGEFSQPKTHDFVFNGLLSKNEDGAISYNKVFKVIDVELAFMYDFFFTKYAVLYYGSRVIRFMSMASACLIPVIASLTLSGVIKDPSGVNSGGVFLDTTEADVAITVAMLVCIALLEVLQLLHYRTTIWGRVSLACQCVREEQEALNKRQKGCCMKFKEILAKVGMSASNDHYFEEKLGQYSLLESVIYHSHQNQSKYGLWISFWYKWTGNIDFELFHPCRNMFRHWRVGQSRKSIRVPAEVKAAVLQSLKRTDGKLTNGASSLEFSRAPHLLWACRHSEPIVSNTQKKENQTCFILTWHIATCYCEMAAEPGGVEGELKVYFDVSTALSKYCAHLVVSAPKLLPGHHYDTRRVFEAVVDEAFEFLGDRKDKYEFLRRSLPAESGSGDVAAGSEEKIFYKGVKLGKQLERMEGARWKVLADFWAEMLLYVAPSDKVKEHVECLAKGGEFITQLWALLTHAGILDRDQKSDVTDIEENGGNQPAPSPTTFVRCKSRSLSFNDIYCSILNTGVPSVLYSMELS